MWHDANALNKLYNHFLNEKNETYKLTGKSPNRYAQQKSIITLKELIPELKGIHSQVLQQVPLRLHKAFKFFFEHQKDGVGPPNYRSCQNFFGICYPQSGYSIKDDIFYTKTYGDIKFYKYRLYLGKVKQVQITNKDNKWYLIITTDYVATKQEVNNRVGIDLGITNLVATSDGAIIKNKRHAKYFDKQIAELDRRNKKCKKGSRKCKFLKRTIKRLYGVKSRKIKDFLHKVSYNLSSNYDTIFCEDLSLKEMSESYITGINRELRNSQLGTFTSFVGYKVHNLVKVNPYNTSKTCNHCGNIMSMPLSVRTYTCPKCGTIEDRDVNAAKNIYCLGQAVLEKGCTVSAYQMSLQEALGFSPG